MIFVWIAVKSRCSDLLKICIFMKTLMANKHGRFRAIFREQTDVQIHLSTLGSNCTWNIKTCLHLCKKNIKTLNAWWKIFFLSPSVLEMIDSKPVLYEAVKSSLPFFQDLRNLLAVFMHYCTFLHLYCCFFLFPQCVWQGEAGENKNGTAISIEMEL